MEKTRNNHEDIYPAGPTYIRSVKAGDHIYISGITARGTSAAGGPPIDQLGIVLNRITDIVEAEGGKPSDIVMMTTYVINMNDFWPIGSEQQKIWNKYFDGVYPTNSYVEVSALAEPDLDIEITATAILA